jgi:hypothetical protein
MEQTVLHVLPGGGWSKIIREDPDGTTLLEIEWPNLSYKDYRERRQEFERRLGDSRPWEFRSPAGIYKECRCEGEPSITESSFGAHRIVIRVRGTKAADMCAKEAKTGE